MRVLPVPRNWSDLSPAWMSAALSRRHPGVVVRDVQVGAVEQGTNTRARVALLLAGGEGPSSVFVKGPGRPSHRMALLALGALATEAKLADAGVSFPLVHPVFYGGGVEWRRAASVVVSEDVVAAGGRPQDARIPLSVEQVRSGLQGLAALHATYWGRPVPASLGHLRAWRLGPVWGLVSVASLARGLRLAAEAEGGPLRLQKDIGARALGDQFRQSAAVAASGPWTVLHGDPHPGNVYTTAEGRTGFFDWQLARLGQWSHDVGYFLAGSLDVEDRQRHERELLASYLDALARAGVRAPSLDAAWSRYRGTPAFGLATWLHTLSFGTFQRADVCMATIRRFAAAYADLGTARSDAAAPRVRRSPFPLRPRGVVDTGAMDAEDLDRDPMHQLDEWLGAARAGGEPMPEAMCIATASRDGEPSARYVLMRGRDEGVVFYTDYGSDKAKDLESNPRAAAVFHWHLPVHRQVRIGGTVARTTAEESDRYWETRPPASRRSAVASRQSAIVGSRRDLEAAVAALGGTEPARPDRWGGYRLLPSTIEFWEEGANRLHDRLRYRRDGDGWRVERLSP